MTQEQPNVARDTDGRGSANQSTDAPADPNVEAVTEAFEGQGVEGQGVEGQGAADGSNDDVPASGISSDGPDAVDLKDFSGASRREPGR